MSELFDLEAPGLHRGYTNLREGASAPERMIRDELAALWRRYEPYADADFRHGFARDPEGRFWEMYLGCALLEAGKTLLLRSARQSTGGQPDLCVLDGTQRIWIEAIAPECGVDGPDQVQGPRPINEGGGFAPLPIRQAQLRVTGALLTKSRIISGYLDAGVIKRDEVRLIAISGGRFARHIPESQVPLILSSVFPIGDQFVTIDRDSRAVTGTGFATSLSIQRANAAEIRRTAFLDPQFADISGAIWSRISIGNTSRQVRPLMLVHNPSAFVPMPRSWGVWDREFVTSQVADGWEAEDIRAPDRAAAADSPTIGQE